jgi:hypothetical protein
MAILPWLSARMRPQQCKLHTTERSLSACIETKWGHNAAAVILPPTAGVVEGSIKIFLDSVRAAGIVTNGVSL